MKRLGKQPPRYNFILNPYQDPRCSTCPGCERKMRQRKLPLVIHMDPAHPVVLNKTCRYCPDCDLLIVHQDELESLLAQMFAQLNPELIGNDYLVIGTIDRADWKRGMKQPQTIDDLLNCLHDFKEVFELKVTGGWGRW